MAGKASWIIRRRIIYSTLMFCAATAMYAVHQNTGSPTEGTAIMAAFGLAATVIGSYIFGAVWDDKPTGSTSE